MSKLHAFKNAELTATEQNNTKGEWGTSSYSSSSHSVRRTRIVKTSNHSHSKEHGHSSGPYSEHDGSPKRKISIILIKRAWTPTRATKPAPMPVHYRPSHC